MAALLGWTAGEVEQCLQELNGGTSYRTTPLTIVPATVGSD